MNITRLIPGARLHRAALAGCLALVTLLAGCHGSAPPRARLWENWTAHNEANTLTPDVSEWNHFLAGHRDTSDPQHALDWTHISPEDITHLQAWIRVQQQLPMSLLALRQQRALWLNLYNAGMVVAVEEAGLPQDTRKLRRARAEKRFIVEGQALSLDDIEHHILRPRWLDPRTVEVLYQASRGGPELPREAYTAEHLDEQLDMAARNFVASGRAAWVDNRGYICESELYRWYADDFGGKRTAVLAHLLSLAPPPLAEEIAASSHVHVCRYDWHLSGIAPPKH